MMAAGREVVYVFGVSRRCGLSTYRRINQRLVLGSNYLDRWNDPGWRPARETLNLPGEMMAWQTGYGTRAYRKQGEAALRSQNRRDAIGDGVDPKNKPHSRKRPPPRARKFGLEYKLKEGRKVWLRLGEEGLAAVLFLVRDHEAKRPGARRAYRRTRRSMITGRWSDENVVQPVQAG
jgi:hypothetical protein